MPGWRKSWVLPAVAAAVLLVASVVAGVLLSDGGESAASTASAADGAAVASTGGAESAATGSGARSSSATGAHGGGAPSRVRPSRPLPDPPLTLTVHDTSVGNPIPSGFLGFSFEFQAVRTYTGSDPSHINPVLVQLIRNLTPGQAPVLRIGGDSTDVSYAPAPGVRPPAYVSYRLTPSWMATTAALARQLRAKMIMGLNLGADEPRLAAAEARAFVKAMGSSLEALEIGNEPNVYGKVTVAHSFFGMPVPARPKNFGYPAFRRQFNAIATAAPSLTLAGPALAIGPTPSNGSWVGSMSRFLAGEHRVSMMTVHRYPLRNCYVPPSSPQYPSIPHLLSSYASAGLANSLKRWVAIAHGQHRLLRVDELNSVACRGKAGVSDTFASALWVTDALFSLARAGVDGIDMHTLPDAAYELFQFSHAGARWQAQVRPVYYGLQLFAQAAPAGAQLLSVGHQGRNSGFSTWATRAPDGTVRVVLINKDQRRDRSVTLHLPAAVTASATVERMRAPSVASTAGVTLGGRSYGAQTASGVLAAPRLARVTATDGTMKLPVPDDSAALVTIPAG
jgi:glycosyl hydrolase family 79